MLTVSKESSNKINTYITSHDNISFDVHIFQ